MPPKTVEVACIELSIVPMVERGNALPYGLACLSHELLIIYSKDSLEYSLQGKVAWNSDWPCSNVKVSLHILNPLNHESNNPLILASVVQCDLVSTIACACSEAKAVEFLIRHGEPTGRVGGCVLAHLIMADNVCSQVYVHPVGIVNYVFLLLIFVFIVSLIVIAIIVAILIRVTTIWVRILVPIILSVPIIVSIVSVILVSIRVIIISVIRWLFNISYQGIVVVVSLGVVGDKDYFISQQSQSPLPIDSLVPSHSSLNCVGASFQRARMTRNATVNIVKIYRNTTELNILVGLADSGTIFLNSE